MTATGTLNLDCIASDPASRFLYGIASANNGSTPGDYSNSRFVLVRSNASPTSLAALSWTVVAQFDGKDYSYSYPTFTSVDCAANVDEAIAVFFRSPYRTTNPVDTLPMGLARNSPYGEWTQIRGYAPYGWTSDRFIHMSYYTEKNEPPSHFVTNHQASVIVTGSADQELQIQNIHRWRSPYDSYISEEDLSIDDNFDYARQGFFASRPVDSRQSIINHRNLFYRISKAYGNATCHTYGYTYVNMFARTSCAFQGPPTTLSDNSGGTSRAIVPIHYYLFAGERINSTFFGGIIDDQGVYKIFTSEALGNRSYIEHIITQPDTSSNFSVHQNFHSVGGLIEGQEPFVVALTSAGLYQFTIFGPDAGKMEGPYKVKVTDDLISLPQRVVRKMNTNALTTIDLAKEYIQIEENRPLKRKIEIGVGVGAVLVVLVVVGLLFWRRRKRRIRRIRKEEEEARETRLVENSVFVGKHEVHSIGLIPEQESSSSLADHTGNSSESSSVQPGLDTRIQSYTYQDEMQQLELVSHPRPNIITSIAEP